MTCVFWLGAGWEVLGLVYDGIGLGFTNSGGTWGKWGMCIGCGGVGGEWVGGLGQGLGGWGGFMSVCVL